MDQEVRQDRGRPFRPQARPRRAPPLGPSCPPRSLLNKRRARWPTQYFSCACTNLPFHLRDAPAIAYKTQGAEGLFRSPLGLSAPIYMLYLLGRYVAHPARRFHCPMPSDQTPNATFGRSVAARDQARRLSCHSPRRQLPRRTAHTGSVKSHHLQAAGCSNVTPPMNAMSAVTTRRITTTDTARSCRPSGERHYSCKCLLLLPTMQQTG